MSQERVILVGVETEKNYLHFDSSMKELKSLTKPPMVKLFFTGAKRQQVDRQTVIGKGKLRNCSSWQKHMKQI